MTGIENFQIIGIDCAADPKDIGVAFARQDGDRLSVEDIGFGASRGGHRTVRLECLANHILNRISSDKHTILSLDAPLGWPQAMTTTLPTHLAGSPDGFDRNADADRFFRRSTDRFVVEKTGKTPIEVGANLIARVTHTALRLLGMIGDRQKLLMPYAPPASSGVSNAIVQVIEVYPALAAPFFVCEKEAPRKKSKKVAKRRKSTDPRRIYWGNIARAVRSRKETKEWPDLLRAITEPSEVGPDPGTISCAESVRLGQNCIDGNTISKDQRDHGLDAILCAWTGFRFLQGECVTPDEAKASHEITDDEVKQEGWIWFDRRVLRTADGQASVKSPSGV